MNKTIKELPEHSRPREKLRERGAAALTDEELIAAIIGMGTARIDVRTMLVVTGEPGRRGSQLSRAITLSYWCRGRESNPYLLSDNGFNSAAYFTEMSYAAISFALRTSRRPSAIAG